MSPTTAENWSHNVELLRERLNAELLAGRDYVETRLHEAFPGFLGSVVKPLARSLWQHIGEAEVRRRVNAHVDVVVAAAADARDLGLAASLEKWTEKALETEELVHRARRRHAAFRQLRDQLAAAFEERVVTIGEFLEKGRGATYEEAVRTAFPDPERIRGIVHRHVDRGRESLALVDANKDLLKVPKPLQKPLLRLARNVLDWYETRVMGEFARIYGSS